jgi:hypothetical protein
MKKPNRERVAWEICRQQRDEARTLRLANSFRAKLGKKASRIETAIIAIPVLHAEKATSRQKIRQVLQSAWTALGKGNTRIKLDFSRTYKIFPGGMLLLLANVALMLEVYPGKVLAKCPPKSMAAQLLRHFGYADKLGVSPMTSQPSHDSVVMWRHVSGTHADGGAITQLLNDLKTDTNATIPEGLYEVLTEALINVRHHAYPKDTDLPEALRRWWIFSRLDNPTPNESGNLYIGVYDVGVGIQTTMRQKLQKTEELLALAEDWSLWGTWPTKHLEKRLLIEAVEHKRSSTGLTFRGNGLPEMKDFVTQTDSGSLSIISGHAQYTCQTSAGGRGYQCDDHTVGTLILWSIPLKYKESS